MTNKPSVYSYLRELEDKKKAIAELEEFISLKKKEYHASIRASQDYIDKNTAQIQQIRSMEIFANIGDIANGLAKEWNVPREDVEIFSWSTADYTTTSPEDIDFIKVIEKWPGHHRMTICIESHDKNHTKPTHSVYFSAPIHLNEIQADGRFLFENLKTEITPNTDGETYDASLTYDNPNNIIVPFPLYTLINQFEDRVEPSDTLSKVILDASDLYSQNELAE